jgi:hypothetical protein
MKIREVIAESEQLDEFLPAIGAAVGGLARGAAAVGNAAVKGAQAIGQGVSNATKTAVQGVEKVGSAVAQGAQKVGSGIAQAGQKVTNVKQAADALGLKPGGKLDLKTLNPKLGKSLSQDGQPQIDKIDPSKGMITLKPNQADGNAQGVSINLDTLQQLLKTQNQMQAKQAATDAEAQAKADQSAAQPDTTGSMGATK